MAPSDIRAPSKIYVMVPVESPRFPDPIAPPRLTVPPTPKNPKKKSPPPQPNKRKEAVLRRKRPRPKKKRKPSPEAWQIRCKLQQRGNSFERILAEESRRGRGITSKKAARRAQRLRRKAKHLRKKQFAESSPARRRWLLYLDSPLWRKEIRPRILKRDGHTCQLCGSKKRLNVHHRSYEQAVLDGLDDSKLITLCRTCHIDIEFVQYDERDPTNTIKRSRPDVELRLQGRLSAQVSGIRDVPETVNGPGSAADAPVRFASTLAGVSGV